MALSMRERIDKTAGNSGNIYIREPIPSLAVRRQKRWSMRRKLAALAGGLVLAVAVGIPAGAQAAVATAQPGAVVNFGPCATVLDTGNQKSATDLGGDSLYFEGLSKATQYCNDQIGNGDQFEIMDSDNNRCLAVNSSKGTVDEDSAAACSTAEYSWDRWTATRVDSSSQIMWLLKNAYNGECLYDDAQEPAIYAGCKSSDGFELFSWSAGL
jgi:hypothetical protein